MGELTLPSVETGTNEAPGWLNTTFGAIGGLANVYAQIESIRNSGNDAPQTVPADATPVAGEVVSDRAPGIDQQTLITVALVGVVIVAGVVAVAWASRG